MRNGPGTGDAAGVLGAPEPDDPELRPPFEVAEPAALSSCIVLSSPHSGRVYPARFLACARLDGAGLRRSEDAFVDQLIEGAVALGMPLLRARFPRAFLDVNREPYELDPRMFDGRLPAFANTRSMRVAGGLGTIPRVVGDSQEIYARRLTVEDGIGRIEQLYKPYHGALRGLMNRAFERFGRAVLVDFHSMPSHGTCGGNDVRFKADIVIGDRYGTSCHPDVSGLLDERLSACGYRIERNKPYAGGYITENYGKPFRGRHAVQVEVNRALYMDETTLVPHTEFARVAADLADALAHLSALAPSDSPCGAVAAE